MPNGRVAPQPHLSARMATCSSNRPAHYQSDRLTAPAWLHCFHFLPDADGHDHEVCMMPCRTRVGWVTFHIVICQMWMRCPRARASGLASVGDSPSLFAPCLFAGSPQEVDGANRERKRDREEEGGSGSWCVCGCVGEGAVPGRARRSGIGAAVLYIVFRSKLILDGSPPSSVRSQLRARGIEEYLSFSLSA